MRLDFVGVDPDNPDDQCPAVFVDPETGDFYLQGETVTDPDVLAWINSDSRILDTESVVMLPARMAAIILEAVNGGTNADRRRFPLAGIPGLTRTYDPGEKEPGFAELLAGMHLVGAAPGDPRRAPHLRPGVPGLACRASRCGGSAQQYRAYTDVVLRRRPPGSDFRRRRDRLRAGIGLCAVGTLADRTCERRRWREVRWLPRRLASTLALPGNPYWVFDDHLARFTIFGGDGEVQGSQFSDDAAGDRNVPVSIRGRLGARHPHQDYRV